MYLIIEIHTGDIFKTTDLTDYHGSDCSNNLIDIIDITLPDNPKIYNPETEDWDSIDNHQQ